ncbi:hypothetical protein CsatA_014907 [Cannabis sativa]
MEKRMEELFEKREKKMKDEIVNGGGEEGLILLMTVGLGSCSKDFSMEKSVCNHGFFMMPPNVWIPSSKSLKRPFRLADDATSLTLTISHYNNYLYVRHSSKTIITIKDQFAIQEQIVRMLRITENDGKDLREFHKVCPQAKEIGFGRLFRSPSLFEDVIKSILLCNCTWGRTLKMAEALCELQFDITQNNLGRRGVKRKLMFPKEREDGSVVKMLGNFPNAREIGDLDESYFMKRMSPLLGYRAKHIYKMAKDIHNSGTLSIVMRELEEASEKRLVREDMIMNKIKGFGPFASANILMCLSYYQKIPVDSETIRHLQQVHGRKKCNKKTIGKEVKETYDKYAPFQCLAYWMEMLEFYENKVGKLSQLPQSSYHIISGSML